MLISLAIAAILTTKPPVAGLTRAIALTYHDITPQKKVWFDCTPKEFEDQIRWLKSHRAHFAHVAEIEKFVREGAPIPPRTVLITFADNYLGFYRYALPILSKYRIPSVQFVHSGYVGSPVGRPKMNWTQLAECVRQGVVIGSQTVSHRPVTDLSPTELNEELRESQRQLQAHLGHPVRYLAFPDGKHNRATEKVASEFYDLAFAETQVPITAKSNRYALPRYVHTQWKKAWTDLTR